MKYQYSIIINNLNMNILKKLKSNTIVLAHCDGPCGVYDPSQARVSAEAVYSMTKKLENEINPHAIARFTRIKEDEAEGAKHHILVLWTDYFKPEHLIKYPDLHDLIWKATKIASACKQEISLTHAKELLDYVKQIHEIFWQTKGKEVPFNTASDIS
ncbi:MAG: superoxide dismutase, Ni [Candidatus Harrisonbacteria bacterium CG10_big_fil_rev_8_21_14_0_10_38_8]|uniref:Superoxide dismutase, Ni n=1 Tax=Candidatus Harrisonbacteria bacterium CG10_big_fil_rev_8_21_14_0_10_38_8 TaxID=1974582 RepID=A0A2M6WK45_9BACT|nr:MAG: superoxide dismutase, Ni [Candidatus Harrisonbacteria bacterium CG10_big_fil_rev_8_21_14_0_10_38_8]